MELKFVTVKDEKVDPFEYGSLILFCINKSGRFIYFSDGIKSNDEIILKCLTLIKNNANSNISLISLPLNKLAYSLLSACWVDTNRLETFAINPEIIYTESVVNFVINPKIYSGKFDLVDITDKVLK